MCFIESFYSVCPEILSLHIAKRCKSNIAMDPFCGAGGNIIQLALTCNLGEHYTVRFITKYLLNCIVLIFVQ